MARCWSASTEAPTPERAAGGLPEAGSEGVWPAKGLASAVLAAFFRLKKPPARFHAREASASRHRSTSLRMLTLPVQPLLGLKSRA